MSYEVERKYPIADAAKTVEQVEALRGTFGEPQWQVDTYYAHPARDFAKTDEALRIRRVDNETFITYKGPKIDTTSKTRLEIEVPLADGRKGADEHARLLNALGFREVAEVSKSRRKAHLVWQAREIEVALDELDSLGSFVELETAADESELEAAKDSLAALADKLGLRNSERRSYLELLLLDRSERKR